MYNRYVPGNDGYTRVVVDEASAHGKSASQNRHQHSHQEKRHTSAGRRNGAQQDLFRSLTAPLEFLSGGENKNAGIAGILKGLHLEDLDSGDVLLLLILLLVFLEGDNTELVITLGLMLLLGLGGETRENQKE